jgi:hypothetical protein
VILLILAIAAFVGWANYGHLLRRGVVRELGLLALRGNSEAFHLSNMTDFAWDRVVFLGPYDDQVMANSALGFEWKGFSKFGLDKSDGFSLLVFANARQVVRAEEIKRCSPDFSEDLLGIAVLREEALFKLVARNGCSVLKRAAETRSNPARQGTRDVAARP